MPIIRPIIRSVIRGVTEGLGAVTTDFVFIMATTGAAETVTIPCQNIGTFDAVIDWGDGSTSEITTYNDADLAHEYADAADHTIRISGTFPNIYFNKVGDKLKLKEVVNLGKVGWTKFNRAFRGCTNLISFTAGNCDTSLVDNMSYMFDGVGCTDLDLTAFNTSSVTDMSNMFYLAVDLATLNVSSFDTSAVTGAGFAAMFEECHSILALDLSSFNTELSTSMATMFHRCTVLHTVDATSFNTAAVTTMYKMIRLCPALTLMDLSGFNTALVENMELMLNTCGLTDPEIDGWDIESVTNFTSFLYGSTIVTSRYDATLIAWDAQEMVDSLSLHFGNSKYTGGGAAAAARASLISNDLATIIDAGIA